MESVTFVLILVATCTRVDAVLCFEFLREFFNIDRLDITANGVFHLDSVSRILEGNPLDSILILPYYQWRSSRNGTGCSIGVDIGSARSSGMHVGGSNRRTLRSSLRRT
jgi:hypothetical protein